MSSAFVPFFRHHSLNTKPTLSPYMPIAEFSKESPINPHIYKKIRKIHENLKVPQVVGFVYVYIYIRVCIYVFSILFPVSTNSSAS
jgi:hypothetical protein